MMARLVLVTFLVLVAAVAYRSFGSPETATGTLTLAQPAPNIGEKASGFTAESVDGKTFKLSDKGVCVLTFWSSLNWYSDQSRPAFAKLARKYDKSDVAFAAVYESGVMGDGGGAPYTVLRDSTGRLASLYNVKRVPRLFLIRNGKVALVQNNYLDEENLKSLKKSIKEALNKEK